MPNRISPSPSVNAGVRGRTVLNRNRRILREILRALSNQTASHPEGGGKSNRKAGKLGLGRLENSFLARLSISHDFECLLRRLTISTEHGACARLSRARWSQDKSFPRCMTVRPYNYEIDFGAFSLI